MARVTVEDCVDKVENRFELVLLASHRARMISSGAPITVDRDNDKNPVVALREIADEQARARGYEGRSDPLAAEACRGRRARSRSRAGARRRPARPSSDAAGDVQFDRMTEEDLLRGLEGWCRRPRPRTKASRLVQRRNARRGAAARALPVASRLARPIIGA